MGYYQSGDYYQRGEVAALARRALPGLARLGGKLLAGGTAAATIYEAYKGVTGAPAAAGASSFAAQMAAQPLDTGRRKYRRINPLNPRALRRSLRRIQGFSRFARKVMHFARPSPRSTRFKFPKRRKR
jgi:hypothetical protein